MPACGVVSVGGQGGILYPPRPSPLCSLLANFQKFDDPAQHLRAALWPLVRFGGGGEFWSLCQE